MHTELGLPPRFDIRLHMLMAARGEPALHSLKRFYRDHFNHALEVASLGHLLLETKLKSNLNLKKIISAIMGIDEKRLLKLWYLTALTHDVGYAIEILKATEKHLSFFTNDIGLKQLQADVRNALENLSKTATDKLSFISPDDQPGEDHGVVGALHLQSLIERIAKDDRNIDPDEYLPVVRAIGLHNLRKPVRFSKDPLAFLLILCDTIQEWNRPRLDYPTAPLRFLSRLSSTEELAGELSGPLRSLQMNLQSEAGSSQLCLPDGVLKVKLGYDAEINRDAGVFNLWLDSATNLQRLDYSGFPEELDIQLEFVTPFFGPLDNETIFDTNLSDRSQLYRLRNAARETHMTFLEDFFPNEACKIDSNSAVTNGWVSHYTKDKNDHLILHLRNLSQARPITRGMDVFHERLREWRDYNLDRSFPGDYAAPPRPE